MDLPKNYDFNNTEKRIISFWEKNKIFSFQKKSKKRIFSIDTPPPYVSAAHLHVGHAMHYSQFEFIARYKRMQGFNVFFPMGFDDNGLPTERFVEKKYNINKSKTTMEEFTKLCLKETDLGSKTYKDLWSRLGISVDWSLTYSTIDKESTRVAQLSFLDLYKKGLVARKNIPVIWDTRLQTTLAQADLNDIEQESYMNDVIFKCGKKDLIISTTRPELIPACVGLFFNPKDSRYKDLKGKKAKVPIYDYEVPIMEDKSVIMEKGTGLMMVCTFGDKEDIEKYLKYHLPLKIVITQDGKMNNDAGFLKGLTIKQAREKIIQELKNKKLLIKQEKVKHVVNISDRSGVEIEFLKSPQWVIKLLDFKRELIGQARKIKWFPEHMKVRYEHWVKNLQWDWVISRQRYYGVPFPIWYSKNDGSIVLPQINELPLDPRNGSKPKGYEQEDLIPEMDVMDTWMTSSLTPYITSHWQSKADLKMIPMSLRPQAHDIIRTWAFYTIVKAYYHEKKIPWEHIMISGHGLDSHGRKMSKSLGNFIESMDVINKYGSDGLRFWASGAHLGKDFPYREKDVEAGLRIITKLYNASRFTLSHLEFDKVKKPKNLEQFDIWLLSKLQKLVKEVTISWENYDYSKAKLLTEQFFWNTFCDYYLEIIKDRLYNPERRGKSARESAQYTLYLTLLTLLKLFAPIIPFITEEIYQIYFKKFDNNISIHISKWPRDNKSFVNEKIEKTGDHAITLISEVRKFKANNKVSLKQPVIISLNAKKLKPYIEDIKAVTSAKEIVNGKLSVKMA